MAALLASDMAALLVPDMAALLVPDMAALLASDVAALLVPDVAALLASDMAALLVPDVAALLASDVAALLASDVAALLVPDMAALLVPDMAALLAPWPPQDPVTVVGWRRPLNPLASVPLSASAARPLPLPTPPPRPPPRPSARPRPPPPAAPPRPPAPLSLGTPRPCSPLPAASSMKAPLSPCASTCSLHVAFDERDTRSARPALPPFPLKVAPSAAASTAGRAIVGSGTMGLGLSEAAVPRGHIVLLEVWSFSLTLEATSRVAALSALFSTAVTPSAFAGLFWNGRSLPVESRAASAPPRPRPRPMPEARPAAPRPPLEARPVLAASRANPRGTGIIDEYVCERDAHVSTERHKRRRKIRIWTPVRLYYGMRSIGYNCSKLTPATPS